jgi:hypothetical protein
MKRQIGSRCPHCGIGAGVITYTETVHEKYPPTFDNPSGSMGPRKAVRYKCSAGHVWEEPSRSDAASA